MYMITVVTTNRHPLLGHIHGDTADSAHIVPTGLGAAVIALFYDIEKQVLDRTGKTIQIVQYQLMPDHFHGVIYVRDPLPAGWQLGRIIAGWKGACSRAFWQRFPQTPPPLNTSTTGNISSRISSQNTSTTGNISSRISSLNASTTGNVSSRIPLFEPGFHDRILQGSGQLQRWITYLHDNPRRLWLKRAHPDLFRIHQQVEVLGISCTTLGNMFLAERPLRKVLQCSRRIPPAELAAKREQCLREAEQGTVFITAAISEGERLISRALREAGYDMIILLNQGFPKPDSPHYKFFKPSGIYFEACAAGKLLLVEPADALFELSEVEQSVYAKAHDIKHDSPRYRFLALNAIGWMMEQA